ncbi:esterase-like activity of phytase family protein [Aquimarina sp. M1]
MSFKKISYITFIFCLGFIVSCGSTNEISRKKEIRVNYLDEYIIYNDSIFPNSKIGGLSGIEYLKEQDTYYIVCDDARNPRFYKASISLKNNKFHLVTLDQLITIKDNKNKFLHSNIADLEAIRSFKNNNLIFTSEGSIKNNYNPAIFITNTTGNYQNEFDLPIYFRVEDDSKNRPRHNGVFEGLAQDIEQKGYWAALELPLELDGNEPTIESSGAPVRITHFNTNTRKADFQFTYPLDKLTKDPKEKFGVNGLTGLLQLNTNQFLVLERGYAAGHGTQGNTVKVYVCDIKEVTNTLDFDSLQNKKHQSATKELLFDFETIRHLLTNQIVDNIEGITFGPTLANGNHSLILISDNNFNPTSEQINQLILLELILQP